MLPGGVVGHTVLQQLHLGATLLGAVLVWAVFYRLVGHLMTQQVLARVEPLGAKRAVVSFGHRVTVCVGFEMRAAEEALATALISAHKAPLVVMGP